VTLTKIAIFAAGYVIGTRAGHERYAQIVEIAERASQRLEEYSERHGSRDAVGRRAARRD
jgi:hypothetical protein